MKPKTRKPIQSFSFSGAAEIRRMPSRHWPDDCPDCGKRMEFQYEPVGRRCSCGRIVTAREVLL